MKRTTTTGVVALAAALSLALAACQPGTPSEQPSAATGSELGANVTVDYNPQPRDNIKDGGTMTTAVAEITAQFNTFQADGTAYTSQFWSWYNPVMATYSPEGKWDFNRDYLTDVNAEIKGEDTIVTYTLRDDAKWNDGTDIDWRAFEAVWKTSKDSSDNNPYKVSSADGYSSITSLVQGDTPKQAVVTFHQWAWWQGQFNYILNPNAAVDPKTFNEAYIENPHAEWGAGPYTVDKYDKQAGTISFKRNEKWWGDPGKLDSRVFRAMESSASINAFKAGEIDSTSVASKERLSQVQGMSGIQVRRSATPSNGLMAVNAESEITKDINVRKAIMLSIDRKTLADIEFEGLNYTENAPGSLTLYPWQPGYADNVTAAGIKHDPAAAGAALEASGYAKGSDGYYAKDGKVLDIRFVSLGDDPVTQAQALAMQSMLKDAGIKLTVINRPVSEFSKVLKEKAWEIFTMGFSSSDPFGLAYFCQIYCNPSNLSPSGTGSEELNNKIAEASKIADTTQQATALNALEVESLQLYGLLPLSNGPAMVAVKDGLANYGASLFYKAKPQDIGWQK